jgi:hypothetical protein
MSTATEETTCRCGRPAVHDPWEDEARYRAEHQRVVTADDIYGDWLRAHEEMRERFGEVLDSEDDGPLEETVRVTMEKIKRECAHWRGELEIAEWLAKPRPEGFSIEETPITTEQAEVGHRILKRADRFEDAIDAIYKAPGLAEGERWAILAALYEAQDQASEELSRFRGDPPA